MHAYFSEFYHSGSLEGYARFCLFFSPDNKPLGYFQFPTLTNKASVDIMFIVRTYSLEHMVSIRLNFKEIAKSFFKVFGQYCIPTSNAPVSP